MSIRPIKNNEIPLLTEFLYEAIFQRDTKNLAPRIIIQEPSLWIYVDEFGTKKDDHCLVAEIDNKIVGAAWVRCIKAFGHISETIPEFAISVYPQFRGKGLGKSLMEAMLKLLKSKGYTLTSLAVQKDNYAVNMYKQVGFEIIDENNEEYIMTCQLD
ncbi:GNAT family N-acetyltransferase [Eubacterium barkeri]|uniref:FR47-like protein n=1 Tax=Eubacterium barkeri TaxID=1528 RepID=A0A1H3BRU1_EUBBA|nr:GNAT family N-acetyltransferase [Eubacterium barkeri]SDX44722.1 FR47-like protein [Eubacterium barkeri]